MRTLTAECSYERVFFAGTLSKDCSADPFLDGAIAFSSSFLWSGHLDEREKWHSWYCCTISVRFGQIFAFVVKYRSLTKY